jgi:hypothetical protein
VSEYDEDEPAPWEEVGNAISPDPSMSVLDQLKFYQYMARKVFPYLDPYETVVLVQIVDRITGWKKREARFSADALFVGDRLYDGIARTMDRSRMMKALRSLEARGLIRRRPQPNSRIRVYWVNPSPDIDVLKGSAPDLRKSAARAGLSRGQIISNRDYVVSPVNSRVSREDTHVSERDTGEPYLENGIIDYNLDNTTHPEPSAPGARSCNDLEEEKVPSAGVDRPDVNPRPRRRMPS